MSQPNALFIIAKMGVKEIDKSGVFESHMWLLNDNEESMKYVSLHNRKTDRAYMGGRIIKVRLATDSEITDHQDLMVGNGRRPMGRTPDRKVVVFHHEPKWNTPWPNHANAYRRMYKCIGYVAWDYEGNG
jgi:hypothetical protein